MSRIPRIRRFALAALALSTSIALFRGDVAQALVIRGDDYLYRGGASAALYRYRLALRLDPRAESAADHFIFAALERRSPGDLNAAVRIADSFLLQSGSNATILADRALCLLIERRYRAAEIDFERSAAISASVQQYVFAGWAARHQGRDGDAKRLWHDALRLSPANAAARRALASLNR
ncbi:MAG TPA: hypothetical protein VGZ02_06365 [Candidatus Baltobacteraceae bacterium]|jgi:tetratricopeptide (TPR) repeat protein|nr:hypothetical protein [Candidatus Baltobacteraceae bacterium]